MTVQDLRDVLREHGSATPPANPARRTEIEGRIRRRRLRRTAVAGVAVAAVATLGFSLVSGLSGTAQPPEQTATAAKPAPELPERFTAPDGTEYRRLATGTVHTKNKKRITLTVPLTGKPLAVAATCEGPWDTSASPRVLVNGAQSPPASFGPCMRKMELKGVVVPPGASEAAIVFDTTTVGSGCRMNLAGTECVERKRKESSWNLGVYEWTPPEQPVDPGQPRELPKRLDGWTLGQTKSGTWPQDRTVTFTTTGGRLGIEKLCTGDLAGHLWFSVKLNGKDTGVSGSCPTWTSGPYPMAMEEFSPPKGKKATVTLTLSMRGEDTNRPVRWQAGLYRK